MAIRIIEVDTTELHCHFSGQTQPQDCMLELEPEAEPPTLTARYNPEIGNAVPGMVWHGRILRWDLPALRAASANALMTKILPLAERVVAGYSCEWDGSNHVGQLDNDAEKASSEIERIIERRLDPVDDLRVWQAAEWLDGLGRRALQAETLGITVATTDEEIAAIAERAEAEGLAEGEADVIEGMEEYLTELRNDLREEAANAD